MKVIAVVATVITGISNFEHSYSKMKNQEPLTIITKRSILEVAAVLDPPLVVNKFTEATLGVSRICRTDSINIGVFQCVIFIIRIHFKD